MSVETICAPVSAPAAAAAPLLRVRDVTIRFGGIIALDAVSFDLREGQILGLIGPNGAGKTTMFNCLTRLYTPNSGEIVFRGQNLLATPPHRVAGLGISRTFQNLALFRTLSVLDNVRVGQHACASGDFLSDALRLPASRRREAELDAEAWDLIESLGLAEVAQRCVADLPTGTQKRVELARALAARPRLVLLDEPAGGLSHHDVAELGRLIDDVRTQRGVTVLLVEHHMGLVMSVSDRVVALDFGRRIAEGSPDEVRNDAEVIRAYLGSAKR